MKLIFEATEYFSIRRRINCGTLKRSSMRASNLSAIDLRSLLIFFVRRLTILRDDSTGISYNVIDIA